MGVIMNKRSFTLIELLIVVSIIALLAALLLPALARVRYRAKLVMCSSNLNQAGIAAQLYANENNRRYPYRKNVMGVNYDKFSVPYYARYQNYAATDDIPVLRSMNLEGIPCPFTTIDWNNTTASRSAGYSYYFGWTAEKGGYPECGLLKVGKKMEFNGDIIDILASDIFHQRERYGIQRVGHPDYGTNILKNIGEEWGSIDGAGRGPLDMNFCRTDGSVFLMNRIVLGDTRLLRLPHENGPDGRNWATDGQMVPLAE